MNSLKLYRGADVIGIVTDPEQEGPQITADLELTAAAVNHQEVIDYILSKKEPGQDPPESLNLWKVGLSRMRTERRRQSSLLLFILVLNLFPGAGSTLDFDYLFIPT
jgi:hypothetical protein